MNQITVNSAVCTGCKTCYKACFIDVIRWDDEARSPIIAYPQDCVGCMYCQASCPVDALKVEIDFDSIRDWSALPGDERTAT